MEAVLLGESIIAVFSSMSQPKRYAIIEQAKTDLYRYIELVYNGKRLHSTLGYMGPVAYRVANSQ